MSRLTDKISYLRGLSEGMKLDPKKDSHRLIQGIIEVLGEVGTSFDALAEAHGEMNEYLESMDASLADLEAAVYEGDAEEAAEENPESGSIQYECPHCGTVVEIDPEDVDFDEDALCPACGKELFPELPPDAEAEKPEA